VTRYAIRHADGRWLALVREHNHVVALWLQKVHQASTWWSMTAATLAALDPQQGALVALDPWTVVTLPLPPLKVRRFYSVKVSGRRDSFGA
jgi:hypothetical protein